MTASAARRCRRCPCFGDEARAYWPLMRLTATTGTEIAGSVVQTMRERTHCCTRTPGGRVRSVAFTRIDCVASSARGATNVIGLLRDDLAVRCRAARRSGPREASVARSSGTLMYASSPSAASIVVMNVAGVTRSPSPDRDVADDAVGGRGHTVVLQAAPGLRESASSPPPVALQPSSPSSRPVRAPRG